MNITRHISQPTLSANDVYDAQKKLLKLQWIAGIQGRDHLLETTNARFPGLALVGHLNFIHPNRAQVLGERELNYLNSLTTEERTSTINTLFTCPETAIIIIAVADYPDELVQAANTYTVPLFHSSRSSPVIIEHLQYYLTRALAPRLTVHGVYMEVMGMGVLITGESGIGKSELALELLSRNHRLIADDAVEFMRVGPDVLVGQCPEALTDYLEVRGLSIINVRNMFGETAIRHKKKLHLIVTLRQLQQSDQGKIDRLQAEQLTRNILDVDIPEVILYVAPGRNLGILVETATRSYILRMRGIDTLDEFSNRQQQLINQQPK
ncbi:MAG: HPr(Ser) kinase/phosphatase [Gammaproteobacteria bacterium]|nr:MAG: HPr(Ser) kinase/phosphatase [Gammaproteobacteria bacterium]